MFSEEAPGMPFYLPKGQMIRNELEAFLRGIQKRVQLSRSTHSVHDEPRSMGEIRALGTL